MASFHPALLIFLSIVVLGDHCFELGSSTTVTYDSRALVIDGKRRLLLSGSIHYPRSTPEVWPELIRKSKEGGLDVIDTYVFWNYHEPVRGQYYFEGRFDLVRFVKAVQAAGLFVNLRIGPYVCAEWNYGGFPLWLHFIPGIQFRTANAPFQKEMERFLTKIVTLMKEENLFATQGGPIILAQIENEYGKVQSAFGIGGVSYLKWATSTAVALNTTVPWIMCLQEDAPDPIINTCDAFYCDGFTPNSPSKPKIWSENYPGWFLSFGYAIPFRLVEDIAFSVALFFAKGGTLQNYYMYYGGTNFGRTAGGPFVATSYDFDAPIDEYGFLRQPKWSHLRDLHKTIKLCEEYLVNLDPTYVSLGVNLEAHIYNGTEGCAAFLANIDNSSDATVSFNGNSYILPAWSISILPDCNNVIFNTAKVISQKTPEGSSRGHEVSMEYSLASSVWEWYKERVGIWDKDNDSLTELGLLEQLNTTGDTSDYLWYSTSIHVNEEMEAFLHVASLGHAALLFLNKRLAGVGYGNKDDASFVIGTNITLNKGNNTLELLSMMVGVKNTGPWFDIDGAGISSVTILDFVNHVEDLSNREWTYQVGTEGESLGLDMMNNANSLIWTSGNVLPTNQSLIWYKTSFTAPEGNGPLALNLSSMGKGQAWVNGQSIGRYWPAYLSPSNGCAKDYDYRRAYDFFNMSIKGCGQPTQVLYHVPRSWVHPGENLLVLHEELGGDPSEITVSTKTGEEVCALVSEQDPPPVDSWEASSMFECLSPEIRLSCERGWRIASVSFASFGTPQGQCGNFSHGACSADGVLPALQEACVGRESCSVAVSALLFGDPCPGVLKSLAVEALCSS